MGAGSEEKTNPMNVEKIDERPKTALPPPQEEEIRSTRLIATLGLAGFFSGLVLVGAYLFTLPVIQANRAEALEEAIYRVLPGATSYVPLELHGGRLVEVAAGSSGGKGEEPPRIFAGYGEDGEFIGFAVPAAEPGFQDVIAAIFGYDPHRRAIIGFEVLDSKETPGLGDKIIKDAAFRANFTELAVEPAIVAVKKGGKTRPNEVEAITGATISSKAIVRLLEKGMEQWRQAMEEKAKRENDK
jgi:electron transport complex protein RnfG